MLNCEILKTSLKATKHFVATAEISQTHCQALYNSYLSCNRHTCTKVMWTLDSVCMASIITFDC